MQDEVLMETGDHVFCESHSHEHGAAFLDPIAGFGIGFVDDLSAFGHAQMFDPFHRRFPIDINDGNILVC